jgi:PAS domain S-box-containing protein
VDLSLQKNEPFRARHSLSRRITIITLVIFLISIWTLSYYTSWILRMDMERLLADQQSSTVSYVAAELNGELEERIHGLEKTARLIDLQMLDRPAALQRSLEDRPILQSMFNAGVFAISRNGVAVADVPVTGRRGVNFSDNEAIHAALTDGKSMIGRPIVGRVLRQPIFNIVASIRDADGKVIGALSGVVNLAKSNFLDIVSEHRYGKSGGYVVIDLRHNLIFAATDKRRVMQMLPAPGVNEMVDRRRQGFMDSAVSVNPQGVEVLSSVSRIPAADWLVVATLPTEEAFAPIYNMQRHIVFAAILLTLIVGGISWWSLRRQFAPLHAAVESLAGMSDPGKPMQALPIMKPDEIGLLVSGFNQMLTALRERETQLEMQRDFFNAVLQQSSEGVILFDPEDFRILELNSSTCRMLGYERDELLALKYSELLNVDTEYIRVNTTDILQGKILLIERNFCKKDGDTIVVEVNACRVRTGGRQLIMVNLRDISEHVRKRSKQELELTAYAKRLEQASQRILVVQEGVKRRFSGELHDRTSPNLAAIRINLSIISRLLPEQSRERAERLEDTKALVDDTDASLRDICNELRPAVLDYAGLAAALTGYARQFAKRTRIMVQVDCANLQHRLAPALESLLFRIYQEALTNCAKHADAKSIAVTLRSSGGAEPIILIIADDGNGFDLQMLEKDEEINGLGLLNMREMIEFSGGRFAIESSFGQGTRIEVII